MKRGVKENLGYEKHLQVCYGTDEHFHVIIQLKLDVKAAFI